MSFNRDVLKAVRSCRKQWFKHSDFFAEEEGQEVFFAEDLWGPVCSLMVRAIHSPRM